MGDQYYVYILANERPTIYIGITNDLLTRAYEHKSGEIEGFTEKYKLHKLVYYEITNSVEAAIAREKQLKNWHREWKLNLIRQSNPELRDLYRDLVDGDIDSEINSE